MNSRTLAKNTKALSPVIATIILVAVTVAIAIAVAAWLGALTFTYTRTEQIQITSATISGTTVTFGLANTGTSDVSLSAASVTGGSNNNLAGTLTATGSTCTVAGGQATISKGSSCNLAVAFTGATFSTGTRYDFKLTSTQGNPFPYSIVA